MQQQNLFAERTTPQTGYFNTTNLAGDELADRRIKSASQEAEVMALFTAQARMSPSQAWDAIERKWPLTSVRRAMTCLTNDGKLRKTGDTRKGVYGAAEFVWEVQK